MQSQALMAYVEMQRRARVCTVCWRDVPYALVCCYSRSVESTLELFGTTLLIRPSNGQTEV